MKILITNPIVHNNTEYGRGIHDLPEELAILFVTEFPWAAQKPGGGEPAGTTAEAPGADTAGVDRLFKRREAGL